MSIFDPSDIPNKAVKGDHNTVFIVSPIQNITLDEEGNLAQKEGGRHYDWINIAQNTPRLTHIGDLTYRPSDGSYCEADTFSPCTGNITLNVLAGKESFGKDLMHGEQSQSALRCTRCKEILFIPTAMVLSTTLLHLAIKQMAPVTTTANFINCCAIGENRGVINKLGFISVACQQLIMLIDNDKSRFKKIDLGFTITPGLDTTRGFCGFDEWVRALIFMLYSENQSFVHEIERVGMPSIAGPATLRC